MKKQRYLILCLVILIPVAQAKVSTPEQQLQVFLKNSQSLTADFRQVAIDESGNPAQTSFGKFYLQRPGKFRWDYLKPFEQQIVSQEGKVWFYDKDLEQVTIKKIDKSLGATPALLLSGEIALNDNFTLQKQGEDEGMQWIRLQPKSQESSFKYILIGLENGAIAGMELSDNFGQLTRIYFSNVKLNQAIDTQVFTFTAPEGVDIFAE